MAEIVLTPIVEQILGKLGSFALEQVLLLRNLKPEILKLEITVKSIKAVLLDAEEKQSHNHQIKLWLDRLSDVMYNADDLLDDFSTEAAVRRQAAARGEMAMSATCWSSVCSQVSSLPKRLMYDIKMARGIKTIQEELDVISKDKEAFNLEVRPEVKAPPPSRETDACPPTIIVGREDDKKNIIHHLLNSNSEANVSVVSIVAMGGLGKTTLAQLVFDDEQVKAHFDFKAWVYVSQSFDVKAILGKMLRSTTDGQSQAGPELDDLQAQLRERIKSKRFLFVLDDVWEESSRSWENLGKYLTAGAIGSKVLLTTRSTKVAKVGGGALNSGKSTGVVEPYHLEGLPEEECWNLLVKRDPQGKIPRDPQVQEIGKQILRKCGGVPLAVSTIAGVLTDSTNPKSEWPAFLEKGFLSIMKQGGEEDPTMSALQLSFNHLPSHMKHCFTYCKLFPKGFRLDIQMLVQLWVALGYVESEDRGYDCFKTLWWRSFFQEVEMDELGNMSKCRMHDLIHDLADLIAGEKIIRSSNRNVLINIPSKTRHLSILDNGNDDPRVEDCGDGLGNASKVRTLICFKSLSNKEVKQVLNNFSGLRVLVIGIVNFSSYDEKNLLNSVDKLKHLRYLAPSSTGKNRLSDSVTNLFNLQVLNLIGIWTLEELPRNIKKLVNLRHLVFILGDHITHMPKGIWKLKFLQTLRWFVVGKRNSSGNGRAELDELKGLNALRGKLTIIGLADAESSRRGVYVLKEKPHLQSLVLDWGRESRYQSRGLFSSRDDNVDDVTPPKLSAHDEEILEMLWPHPNLQKLSIVSGYEGVKVPNWLSGLTNLVEFSLEDCELCEYLPPQMHQMSSLKKLTIKNCPLLKGMIDNDGDHCRDNSTTRLKTDEEEDDDEWSQTFHCLAHLSIEGCPRLIRLPTFPTVQGELQWENLSLAPIARTLKMKMRGGGVDTNVHPLSKLTKLKLYFIHDDLESLSHRHCSSCLVSLQELSFFNCTRGVKLPGSLCSSMYLTKIYIRECGTVKYLPPLHELASLRKLTIEDCWSLKECWWTNNKNKNDDYYNFDPSMVREEKEDEEEWPHFPRLSSLEVIGCPNLTRMPLFPTVEDKLILHKTSPEALVRTMKMKPVVASSSSSSPGTALVAPLSKLTTLWLGWMKDLECLPEEGLRNLTSLRVLYIENCPKLASLPPTMRQLTSLRSLDICNCPVLEERCRKGEGEDWPNISHISNIRLHEILSAVDLEVRLWRFREGV